jgi:DNA invertase Pin-like site-specific DNA recombinase
MLDRIESNGVRIVIVEGADRLARSVMAQELAVMACQERGIQIITSSGQNLTESDDPAKVAMRQMASVFSQFEKSRLVGKLAAARKRRTFYRIAKMLADEGFLNSNGNAYDKNQIKKLCEA